MSKPDIADSPEFEDALGKGLRALHHMADYVLEDGIQKRMLELGENKEHLTEPEQEELQALIRFTEQRQIEKLEAQVAIKALSKFVPELLAS